MNKIISIITLSLLAIGFHGAISFEIIIVCIIFGIFITYLNKELITEKITFKIGYYWIKFISILFYEVIKANVEVAFIILNPKLVLEPQIVKYETSLKSFRNKTILANSITLTPGTLTVAVNENILSIHCLKTKYVKGLKDNPFEKILLEIEGSKMH